MKETPRRTKQCTGKLPLFGAEKKVELRETQRAVTPFGGLVVFLEFLRHVGYREAVSKYGENSGDPAHFSSHRFSEMLHELGPAARSSWAGRSFEFLQQQHR